MSEDRLDYDRLVADYDTGLIDTLRGFGPANDYLELWVPDEDATASLLNMIEAASAAGRDGFSVKIGQTTAKGLDRNALRKTLGQWADVDLSEDNGALNLDFTALGKRRQSRPGIKSKVNPGRPKVVRETIRRKETQTGPITAIGPLYSRAIERLSTRHEGPGAGIGVTEGGVTLSLDVDPRSHVISRAAYEGAAGPVQKGLLEAFCALIEGLPLIEAADHGAIRLEFILREDVDARPVPGVVTPQAADPAFAWVERLIRKALGAYREKSGFDKTKNEYDPAPAQAWLSLCEDERREKLLSAISGLGYGPGDVAVTAIEYDIRVVVRFSDSLAQGDKQRHMMTIERGLKTHVDPRLELYLEELKDENILRRLGEGGEKP
ncbi:MAG TPA: hypothetical protein ENI72_01550 [Rhodospirillales bacterium]|nr:hypothetical protein [Rhodospirillales bacterium]